MAQPGTGVQLYKLAQDREIKPTNVVADDDICARQMYELGLNLFWSIFVNSIAIELGDNKAMRLGYDVQQSIGLNVER